MDCHNGNLMGEINGGFLNGAPADDRMLHGRRKRKLSLGPSMMIRATIHEFEIYEKEIDSFKVKFIKAFDYLEPWLRSVTRSSVQQTIQQKQQQGKHSSLHHEDDVTTSSRRHGSRDLCLEEELEMRLGRMTSVVHSLRTMWGAERDLKHALTRQSSEARDTCLRLVADMIQHFYSELETLHHRLLQMDNTLQEVDQEKEKMRLSYETQISETATKVDTLEVDLEDAQRMVKQLKQQAAKLSGTNALLEEENKTLRREVAHFQDSMKVAKEKVATQESQLSSQAHLQMLLDMALEKLRVYEEHGVHFKLKHKRSFDLDSTINGRNNNDSPTYKDMSGSPASLRHFVSYNSSILSNNQEDMSDTKSIDLPLSRSVYKKQGILYDSLSSFDTISELSLPLQESSRCVSEDRISMMSSQSRPSLQQQLSQQSILSNHQHQHSQYQQHQQQQQQQQQHQQQQKHQQQQLQQQNQPHQPEQQQHKQKQQPQLEKQQEQQHQKQHKQQQKQQQLEQQKLQKQQQQQEKQQIKQQKKQQKQLEKAGSISPESLQNYSSSQITPKRKSKKLIFGKGFRKRAGSTDTSPPSTISSGSIDKLSTFLDESPPNKLPLSATRSCENLISMAKSKSASNTPSPQRRHMNAHETSVNINNEYEDNWRTLRNQLSALSKSNDTGLNALNVTCNGLNTPSARQRAGSVHAALCDTTPSDKDRLKTPKKHGLVAFAKDIEKRFKKKRRSKTVDFSELKQHIQSQSMDHLADNAL